MLATAVDPQDTGLDLVRGAGHVAVDLGRGFKNAADANPWLRQASELFVAYLGFTWASDAVGGGKRGWAAGLLAGFVALAAVHAGLTGQDFKSSVDDVKASTGRISSELGAAINSAFGVPPAVAGESVSAPVQAPAPSAGNVSAGLSHDFSMADDAKMRRIAPPVPKPQYVYTGPALPNGFSPS